MKVHRNLAAVLGTLVLFAVAAVGEDKPWRETRSPHFRVITNGSEKNARQAARAFEQMRAMFAEQFPGFHVDPPAPLLILAPEDERTTKMLVPEFWQHGGPKPAGIYFHGWEKQYALVRLDAIGSDFNPGQFAVVYHEYLHSLLHLNFRWLPTWLDEGLAEFYAYTRFQAKETLVGAPPRNIERLRVLYRRSTMPLAKFLEQVGSFTRDEDDTELYYAQSWALTHFLIMGPNMEKGARLRRFFNALQAGTEQKKAFQDAFGAFPEVQKGLDQYIYRFAFPAGVIPSPPLIDDKSFPSRTMNLAETQAELASFFASNHNTKEGRAFSERAIKNDPKLAVAHETLGFVNLLEGKDEDAVREFSQSLELDNTMYRALFAKTMLSALPHATSASDRELYQSSLMRVLNINPQFAPAYVELAKSFVVQGELTRALAVARTAEKMEPARAGYHLLTGQILLRMGQPVEAARHAAYVANRWTSPDRDEAMELWNVVPAAQRPADGPTESPAGEFRSAEGTVKSVACENNSFTLTLEQAGQPLSFRFERASGGFADTLWFGHDHFTPCYHVTGLRAVVRYKPSSEKASTFEAVSFGFRDDLPPAQSPGAVAAQQK